MNIGESIYNLREYGIMLQQKDGLNVKRLIDSFYTEINTVEEVFVPYYSDDEFTTLLNIINEYIELNGVELIKNRYCIPVTEFPLIFKNSDYSDIRIKELRKQLKATHLIYSTDKKRTETLETLSVVSKVAGKEETTKIKKRVIAFEQAFMNIWKKSLEKKNR